MPFCINSSVLIRNLFVALLRYATSLAILLRHNLPAHLQGVTCVAIIKSRSVLLSEVESGSTFRKHDIFKSAARNISAEQPIKTRCLKIDPSLH